MISLDYMAGFFDGEGSIGIYKNGWGFYGLRTQLTQNVTPATTNLLNEFLARYGGNLSMMRSTIYKRNAAYNWQLNGDKAAEFLQELMPCLLLKLDQARVALAWNQLRPKMSRDAKGRILAHERGSQLDVQTSLLLKSLKRATFAEVLKEGAPGTPAITLLGLRVGIHDS